MAYLELNGEEMHWRVSAKYTENGVILLVNNYTSGVEAPLFIPYDNKVYPTLHRISIPALIAKITEWIRLTGDWATVINYEVIGDVFLDAYVFDGYLYPIVKEFAQISSPLIESI